MAHLTSWLCVIAIVGGVSSTATAATKLCMTALDVTTIEVPPDPYFAFVATTEARDQITERWKPRPGKTFEDTVTPIDDYRAKRKVHARPGESFVIGRETCHAYRYRVTATWTRESALPRILDAELNSNNVAILRRVRSKQLSWVRIDWAYRAEDLENGLHGSLFEEDRPGAYQPDSYLRLAPNVPLVHVRVIRFDLDGSETSWRGWLHHQSGQFRVGTGPAPKVGPTPATDLAAACNAADARAVPVDATFRSPVVFAERYVAMTCDGQLLPVTRDIDEEWPTRGTRVTVAAPAGQRFWLRPLPLPPGPPTERLLVATTTQYLDVPPVVVGAKPFACDVELQLADEETWDKLEVSAVPVFETKSLESAMFIADDVQAPTLDASPLRVTITPIWSGRRGTPWQGIVHGSSCDYAAFMPFPSTAPPTPPAPLEGPLLCGMASRPMRHEQPNWLAALGSVLGLLVLVALGRRASHID